MVRGSILFFVVFYSLLFLSKKYFRHQWAGIIITFAGVVLVGWGGI